MKKLMVALGLALLVVSLSLPTLAKSYSLDFEDGSTGPLQFFGSEPWVIFDDTVIGSKVMQPPTYERALTKLGTYALFPDTYTDFVLEADARWYEEETTGTFGLVYGFTDDTNYSYAYISHSRTNMRSGVNGDFATLFDLGEVVVGPDAVYHVKIERVAGHVKVSVDGNVVMEVDDPNNLTGRIGIGSWTQQAIWDNVKVYVP